MHDWSEISPSKRPHHLLMTSSTSTTIPQLYTNHPSLFDYQNGILHQEQMVNIIYYSYIANISKKFI